MTSKDPKTSKQGNDSKRKHTTLKSLQKLEIISTLESSER
jgi:hypothetical protein